MSMMKAPVWRETLLGCLIEMQWLSRSRTLTAVNYGLPPLIHGTWVSEEIHFQYSILSKRSSKIPAEILSGNYVLTLQGAEKDREEAPCCGVSNTYEHMWTCVYIRACVCVL